MMKSLGGLGHYAVASQPCPYRGSLNRWICGSAFGYAQIPQGGTSHIPETLIEMPAVAFKRVKIENKINIRWLK